MSLLYSGFPSESLETNYNQKLLELVLTLAHRLNLALRNSKLTQSNQRCVETAEEFAQNEAEVKICARLDRLFSQLSSLERRKQSKPYFAQACTGLSDTIRNLLAPNGKPNIAQVGAQSISDSLEHDSLFCETDRAHKLRHEAHKKGVKQGGNTVN